MEAAFTQSHHLILCLLGGITEDLCVCVGQHLRSGTTGVAAFIHGNELTVAWLGDSQAVLVRKGEVVTLMDPHKPDREVGGLQTHTELMLLIWKYTSPDANDNKCDTHYPIVSVASFWSFTITFFYCSLIVLFVNHTLLLDKLYYFVQNPVTYIVV